MSRKRLTTYLNDHLAGSVAALELLDRLAALQPGSEREDRFRRLRAEVDEDQKVLQQILDRVGGKESPIRKAAAWVAEKMGEAKFQFDDPGTGELQVLEALEALSLGILGKLALWRALDALGDRLPEIRMMDLERLKRRALQQHERVESERIEAARAALAS